METRDRITSPQTAISLMDGRVQVRDGDDAQQEPEWKMRGRKVYKRLFGWWERGVPPTWLVIVGCLVVQVGVVIISVQILALIFKAPLL